MRKFTKKELYHEISVIRKASNITFDSYPLNSIQLCEHSPNIKVALVRFKTPGLRGMVSIAPNENDSHVILINANRPPDEYNFICTHEVMHLYLHRDCGAQSFNCFEPACPDQDLGVEWQANEGAAELLVPASLLLPKIRERFDHLYYKEDYENFKCELAEQFAVSYGVVNFRFESLKYEIHQYLAGAKLNEIQVLSHKRQKEMGIAVESLNDLQSDAPKLLRCRGILA